MKSLKALKTFQPSKYQTKDNWNVHLKQYNPHSQDLKMDVMFVGGGPGGLSGAIRLKQLCQRDFPNIQIGILEKAGRIGGHSLSGAIINPTPFQTLFPDTTEKDRPFREKVKKEKLFFLTQNRKWPLPLPPTMKNKNLYTASVCEVLRWMAKKAEAMNINIFTSFTADKLLIDEKKVIGITTYPKGLNKDGSKDPSYQESISICSKLLVLAEGSRGHLTQTWMNWKGIRSHYPQTYALGIKEIWEIPAGRPLQSVIHTMGWPLPSDCFGGSWLYPMGQNTLSLGLVAGLNSPHKNLDIHLKLQELKNHPLFKLILQGGKCVEWGAKTIPEGGYHSMPDQLHDHGLLILGDAAGMVNVPALKGIHYAMTAGLLAAEKIFSCLKQNDFSKDSLKAYTHKVKHKSCIGKELYPVRNVRQAFDKNIFIGLFKSGLMFLTRGIFPGDTKNKKLKTDAEQTKSKKMKYFHKTNKKNRSCFFVREQNP